MNKRMLLVLLLSTLVLDCASSGDFDVLLGHEPVIHDSYAASVIRPGATWRIYIHAEDYEGDMKEIVTFVTQTGTAPFPTHRIKLKGDDTKEIAGYLYVNTTRDMLLIGDRVEVLLIIRDQKENESRPLKFIVGFNAAALPEVPEKWKGSANRKLGFIIYEDIEPSISRTTQPDSL